MENTIFNGTNDQYKLYQAHSIKNALDAENINKDEANLIKEFITEIGIQNNLSDIRKMKLTGNLCQSLKYLEPSLTDATIGDIYQAFEGIKSGKTKNDTPYTQNTISDLQRILKRFLKWSVENGYVKLDLRKIERIKVTRGLSVTKTEADILTEEEVTKLINTPKSIRYRALLGVLYEGGFRIKEIACLKWDDVRFLNWGCRIRTNGKTGKERVVPILTYGEYLAKYKSEHPDPNPDSLVFLNEHNKPLKYQSFCKVLSKFCKEAGIDKPITPHTLRHSRITHCLRRGMQETICKKTFWGNQTTNMIQVYGHLTPDDSEKAFARIAGIDIPDDDNKDHAADPIQCMRCHTINPPGARFCSKCGMSLTGDSMKEYDTALAYLEDAFKTLSESQRVEVISALVKLGKQNNQSI